MPTYLEQLIEKAKRAKKGGDEEEKRKGEKEEREEREEIRVDELKKKGMILEKPQKKEKEIQIKDIMEEVQKGEEEKKPKRAEETKYEKVESSVEVEMEGVDKEKIASYGDVTIYRIPGKAVLYYQIPVLKPTSGERAIISTIKEAATRLISIAPYRIRDPEQRRNVYRQRILEILHASRELNIPSGRYEFYAEAVVREMVGLGMIDPLIRDDQLEEIMVIGPHKPVYVFHRKYEMMVTNIEFVSDEEIIDLINRIAREVGRRVDLSSPLLDARLADGSRVNATIPPASISGASLTIRKFREDPYTIVDLINFNTVDIPTAAFLWACVDGLGAKPANILITGGTGSGKTTFLNVLASFIPARERIITIEDTAELNLPLRHFISFEARPPGIEGTGEITLDILTKNALRMRPDRIIVGEVRHAEAFTLFTAMNTGHDGAVIENSLIQMADGSIQRADKLSEKYFGENEIKKENGFEFVELKEKPKIIAVDKTDFCEKEALIERIWRKNAKTKSVEITLASGKEIELSLDHPIFRLKNGFVEQVHCSECSEGDYIASLTSVCLKGEQEDEEMAYAVGLILGDGHLRKDRIEFVNNEIKLHKKFGKIIERNFNKKTKILKNKKENTFRSILNSVEVSRKLNLLYEIPFGRKTKIFDVPKKIEKSNTAVVSAFLKGLYDCEGSVSKHRPVIFFSTANKNLCNKLPLLLNRIGIHSRASKQEKDGKGNIGPYYRITISGQKNLEKFSKEIGFNHPKKAERTERITGKKYNTNVDIIPSTGKIIASIRKSLGLSQMELAEKCLCSKTRSTINSIECGKRMPSKSIIKKINSFFMNEFNKKTRKGRELSEARKLILHLNSISSETILWDKIKKIERKERIKAFYDFTLNDYHTYIANGLMVSNCMGTVHANSPLETIVRVTSPPMSVPEVMMAGLDFIVVEHRIHDKKKGTIRRITNISEVIGTLEGKTKTDTLFEWNPVQDSMTAVKKDSRYVNELMRFTGLTKAQINAELKEREKVLKELIKKDIRSLKEVCDIVQNFYVEKKVS